MCQRNGEEVPRGRSQIKGSKGQGYYEYDPKEKKKRVMTNTAMKGGK